MQLVRNMMETPCKILILVIFTLTLVEAKDDRDIREGEEIITEVKEIMMELKEKVARTENELMATKDELSATKDELANTTKELNAALNNPTITTKDDLKMLEKEVTIILQPPHLYICGSHSEALSHYNSKLFYSATNTEGGGYY